MTELTPFDEGYVAPAAPPPPPPPEAKPFPDDPATPAAKAARKPAAPRAPKEPAAPPPPVVPMDPATTGSLAEFLDDFGLSGIPKPAPSGPNFDRDRWGLFPDMTAEEYYADPCPDVSISNSGITKLLDETPYDFAFAHPRLNPAGGAQAAKDTAAKRRGDLVHQLALGKGKGFAVGAEAWTTWQTNASKAFKAEAEEAGLVPVLPHQLAAAKPIAAAVQERIRRALDGADYQTEVPFLFQVATGAGLIWVRGMLDVWCEERAIILDPKITPRLYDGRTGEKVGRHMVDMGWARQSALYTFGVGQIRPDLAGRIRFADLMVKPEAPYTSRMVRAERYWESAMIHECEDAFEVFGRCLYSGEWPAFPDKVEAIPCPPWEMKRLDAQHNGELAK